MPRVRSFAAIALLLVLTGPVILAAGGRGRSCSMCAERCCCRPPEGSGMIAACRVSRPCAAGQERGTAPLVASDPAVLDRNAPGIVPPSGSGLLGIPRFVSSGRTVSPPVPPPRA